MRAAAGVWRWRRSPLCRATDRREAWVALAALLLMTLVAPALGGVCGVLTDESLQRSARAERAERRATTAVVLGPASASSRVVAGPEGVSDRTARTSVVVRWRAPDGTERRGTVAAPPGRTAPGTGVRIWTDRAGRVVARPMDVPTARAHAVLAGLGAAMLAAGLIECVRRLIVRHMVRARHALIDRTWAEAGPDWGRTGTGT
ncbi:hypothetical protein ACF1BP_16730 [Streptomyces sp. NPDC014735]|uniref:Rv1733c family protein n=1 Tax=unclassified Streptomyces TaxID=2593676 RepID=UPI003700085B